MKKIGCRFHNEEVVNLIYVLIVIHEDKRPDSGADGGEVGRGFDGQRRDSGFRRRSEKVARPAPLWGRWTAPTLCPGAKAGGVADVDQAVVRRLDRMHRADRRNYLRHQGRPHTVPTRHSEFSSTGN